MTVEREIVWLKERRHYATLIYRGTYYSVVSWFEDAIEYEDTIENDDYEFFEERAIEFDSDG